MKIVSGYVGRFVVWCKPERGPDHHTKTVSCNFQTNKWCVCFSILCLAIVFFAFIVQSWRMSRVERFFVFSRDVAEYVRTNKQLPPSIGEFCDWKTNETGRQIWDTNMTGKRLHFAKVSISDVVHGENQFIVIDDPKFKKYESAINQHLIGGLPLELFDRDAETENGIGTK